MILSMNNRTRAVVFAFEIVFIFRVCIVVVRKSNTFFYINTGPDIGLNNKDKSYHLQFSFYKFSS